MSNVKKSLLVVEDDPNIRESIKDIASLDGFEVLQAGNGKEALELIEQIEVLPGLILLDLMMPVMDGYRFLSEFAKSPKFGIPVVVVSAAKKENLNNVIEFIEKPANARQILNIIKKYCGESP